MKRKFMDCAAWYSPIWTDCSVPQHSSKINAQFISRPCLYAILFVVLLVVWFYFIFLVPTWFSKCLINFFIIHNFIGGLFHKNCFCKQISNEVICQINIIYQIRLFAWHTKQALIQWLSKKYFYSKIFINSTCFKTLNKNKSK